MPKQENLHTIMVLGSGPIVIGQACEFDYSGTQGCKALREEGCRIILLNSNPATVMTDPGFSDRTYLEPLTLQMASAIIAQERPDALLPTLGGQTALNLAMELHQAGVLARYGVRMIGARPQAIELAENRRLFHDTMLNAGLMLPKSGLATSVPQALQIAREVKFPAIIRPSYTLGGSGGGIAYNLEECEEIARRGLAASPIGQVLVEESVLGWKEIELEVMRDQADNAIVVCGIENLDPMGIHTGDSITVAPIQTLSDMEYQALRNDALTVVRAVGVDTGGCNIQFAVNPQNGRRVVIEMNPRVSRSSALASKATGFPIARVAAKLALGYRLDELRNDITQTSACFEPTLDYCVVKVPRFDFAKFAGADATLGLQMHSVGETMALGGNFREALQKALRGLETGLPGLTPPPRVDGASAIARSERLSQLRLHLRHNQPERLLYLYEALRLGMGYQEAHQLTAIDPWFLLQLKQIQQTEEMIKNELAPQLAAGTPDKSEDEQKLARLLRHIKAQGFSDQHLAALLKSALDKADISAASIRALRLKLNVRPVFRSVDTCAGEFVARTPYFYSTYDAASDDPEHAASLSASASHAPTRANLPRKVVILGGGPNRIGQGLEFDYCCVQASRALQGLGITTVMVNSNPETVSTDFDSASRLYFEPVTVEDVLAICEAENLAEGNGAVIVQMGGQTPLNIASALEKAGVPILGTRPAAIALAEDREDFSTLVERLGISQPPSGMAHNEESACRIARDIGYPVLLRPSFVLGGRAMRVIHHETDLRAYMNSQGWRAAFNMSGGPRILVDKFLEDAVEVDVDAIADGNDVTIAAVMEHIEQAGVHSGDSCCSIPPHSLSEAILAVIRSHTRRLGLALGTRGLLNVQFAIRNGQVFVLEANPRASRTVPFVCKATGRNIAGIAAQVMAGLSLAETNFRAEPIIGYHAVKEAVLPFDKFPGAEIALGPEMRSTGEVMGIDLTFGMAFLKAQAAAGTPIPNSGNVILSVSDRDKKTLIPLARRLKKLGFSLYATPGTLAALLNSGIACELIVKIGPERPHLLDFLRNGEASMIINTISGPASARDATVIRAQALSRKITLLTTVAALNAAIAGLEERKLKPCNVAPLQDYYGKPLKTGR